MRVRTVGMNRSILHIFFILIVCCCVSTPSPAGTGDWRTFTDMKSIRFLASDGATLWAATAGGLFRFDPADSSYEKYINSDGLSSNDVTAVTVDVQGRIWVGMQNGAVDIYDPKSRSWRYISNIKDDNTKAVRAINAFTQNGDRMYIATSFGVAVFSIAKFEFSETYTGFAGGISQPSVRSVAVNAGRVYLATSAGIISSNDGAVNLADPVSWTVEAPGVTSVNAIRSFGGKLYASATTGLYVASSGSWNIIAGVTGSARIIAALDTSLLFVEGTTLNSLNGVARLFRFPVVVPGGITSGTTTSGRTVYLGTAAGIISAGTGGQWFTYAPNGPNSNSFYKMVVDEKGELWCASGGFTGGWGFYRYDGVRWTNYTTANTPLLLVNDCYEIAVGPNNSKWVSTWGEGAVLVNNEGRVVRRYDFDYPGFIGVIRTGTNIPSYSVPSKAAVDRAGNVWIATVFSNDRTKVLWKMAPDSTWQSYPGLPAPYDFAFMYEMVIDQNDTRWFTNSIITRQESPVVAYHNTGNTVAGISDSWGMLTESDGLSDERVQALAVDKDGDVWMGTGVGITIINEPRTPKLRISKVFDLSVRDLFINCIAVDPLNNKWIGTSKGVFILSPDGTQQLGFYSVENTNGKLVDNNIGSIAIDGKNGIVYLGTEKGLSSLQIAAVTAKNTMSAIDISPNPIYLPNQSSMEIRGLTDDCTIKVLALNGKVVKQFPAQGGGRAFWDCRDGEGRMVASGIYIIVAHNKAGEQVASAKAAVIRR